MTAITRSRDASSAPTKPYEAGVVAPGVAAKATSEPPCVIFNIEDRVRLNDESPERHKTVRNLAANWSTDEKRRAAIDSARTWFVDTFHRDDGDTVRTLRLRKQWSQTQLAERLGTSQPHIVRIERGTENLTIETCRRLCSALGVDMNTLDQALRRQELRASAKSATPKDQ